MPDPSHVGRGRDFVWAVLTGIVVGLFTYGVSLAVGVLAASDFSDPATDSIGPAIGAGIGAVIVSYLTSRPGSRLALSDQVSSSIWSRRIPADADADRWLRLVRRTRAAGRITAWLGPVLLVGFAALCWVVSGDGESDSTFFRIASVVFVMVAIAIPFAVRWERRRLDGLEQELLRRQRE